MTDSLERLQSSLAEQYSIERELGRGGMAQVFLAQQRHPRRHVAIKVLDPSIAAVIGPDRFLREVDLASKLAHPHILPVFAAGEADGCLYYVMPYVEGESLRQRLDREKLLPVGEAVRIAREVAGALAYAHARGVVHRDIKPENLLLQSGHAVVADFGIALAITVAGGDRITMTGIVLGTPAYMSPEQAAGDPNVDSRSDLYSLGCVLYEMLVGEAPFTGPTAANVVAQHFSAEPRALTERRPEIPESIARAVSRAMAKSPGDRFATASAFAEALAGGDSATQAAARPNAKRFALSRAGLISVAAVVLIALAALIFRPRGGPLLDPNAVAVFPFRVLGNDIAYLREGMVDLLAAKLTGEGGFRSVDPRTVIAAWRKAGGSETRDLTEPASLEAASQIGARYALNGSVVATPGQLELTARLVAVGGKSDTVNATVVGPPDSLHVLIDQLGAKLLAIGAGAGDRLDALTSSKLPALRTYLEGQAAYRRGQYAMAEERFVRALELDSAFALAGLGLVSARYWIKGEFDEAGMAAAWTHRARLSLRDSAMLVGITGPEYPGAIVSLRNQILALERAVSLAPDRPEAWYWLGETLYHTGAASDIADPNARAAEAFYRATRLDPDFAAPMEHLLDLAAVAGDTAAVRRYADRYLTLQPVGDQSDFTRWRSAVALGDTSLLRQLRARFDSTSTASLLGILGAGVFDAVGLDDVDRAIAVLRSRAETQDVKVRNLLRVYETLLDLGRPAAALEVTRVIGNLDSGSRRHLALRILGALFGGADTTAAAEAARELGPEVTAALRDPSAPLPYVNVCAVMLWRLSQGETGGVRTAVDRLSELARMPGRDAASASQGAWTCELTLAALLEAIENRSGARIALARLDSISRGGPEGSQEVLNAMNLTAARLFERQGDLARARAAVRRYFHYRGTYLSTRLVDEGRLCEKLGDREAAMVAYRHYLALRWKPEPSVLPEVEAVRSALARLERERPG